MLRNRQRPILESRLDSTARLVALVYTHFTDAHVGLAWPSVQTVALETGLNERTVRKALRRLEAAGVLLAIGPRGGGLKRTITYRMDWVRLAALARNTGGPNGGLEGPEGGTTTPRTSSMNNPEKIQRGAGGHEGPEPTGHGIRSAPSPEEQDQSLRHLVGLGVSPRTAARLAQAHQPDQVLEVIRQMSQRRGEPIGNRAGYVVRALQAKSPSALGTLAGGVPAYLSPTPGHKPDCIQDERCVEARKARRGSW